MKIFSLKNCYLIFVLGCLSLYPVKPFAQDVYLKSEDVGVASMNDVFGMEYLMRSQNGITGLYDSRLFLGSAIISNGRFILGKKWFLWSDKPETFCGKLELFGSRRERLFALLERGQEMDWVIRMEPGTGFEHLIAHTYHKNLLAAEVTPHKSLLDNPWFELEEKKTTLSDTNICACGPYARDKEHNKFGPKMEIHPAHLLWWEEPLQSEGRSFTCMAIQDNSNRFTSQYGRHGLSEQVRQQLTSWVESPLKARFRIAFVLPEQVDSPLMIRLKSLYKRDVLKRSAPEKYSTLYYQQKKMITLENVDDIEVRFVDIKKREDGLLQGFIELTTQTGIADKYGAYHIFKADMAQMPTIEANYFNEEKCGESYYLLWVRSQQLAHLNKLILAHSDAINDAHGKAAKTLKLQRHLLQEKLKVVNMMITEATRSLDDCLKQ